MIAKSTFHKKPPMLWDWKAKIKWQTAAKRINHASMSTIPTGEGHSYGKDATEKHENPPEH